MRMKQALVRSLFGFDVFRRGLGENREQSAGSWRRRNFAFTNNFLCAQFPAVERLVATFVGTQCRPRQRDAREQTLGPRIRKYFGFENDICLGRGIASHGTSYGGGVGAEFDLARHDGVRAAFVHDKQNKIGSLRTDLQAKTAALEREHGGSTPAAGKFLSLAADDHPAPIAASNDESGLFHRRIDHHAQGLVEQVFWNAFRNIENFLENHRRLFYAVSFLLFLFFRKDGYGKQECQSRDERLCSHESSV